MRDWAERVGPVTVRDIVWHPRCNWRGEPQGSRAQVAAIKKAVSIIAAQHPYARIES